MIGFPSAAYTSFYYPCICEYDCICDTTNIHLHNMYDLASLLRLCVHNVMVRTELKKTTK